jgi:stage V sporulation protein SpoVS
MSFGPERSRSNRRRVSENRNRPRSTPYDRQQRNNAAGDGSSGAQLFGDDDSRALINCIKVSATSNVKPVAGKIAHSCRDGEPPAILTIGASCINQAIKAIAVARGYLSNDALDVSFQPAFRDRDRNRPSIALYLSTQAPFRASAGSEETELPVSSASQPTVVAGALAARVREGKRVCLTSIGVDAVANAVLAIGNARLYLEADQLDIRATPEFVRVRKNNVELSAVKFNILPEGI